MRVRILFYGGLQRISGARQLQLEFSEDQLSVKQFSRLLLEKRPELKPYLASTVYSIGAKIASPDEIICDGAEIGLLPPVSGG